VNFLFLCPKICITYSNLSGDREQKASVKNGTVYSSSATKAEFLYISAQNNKDKGSVTVSIKEDGTTLKTSSSDEHM
jgi:hypothetical protein